MVKLTFFGAVNEIGGGKTLLSFKDTNLMLDFGRDFMPSVEYFSEKLQPSSYNPLKDFIALNIVPPIASLYKSYEIDEAKNIIKNNFNENIKVDAVLISHTHLDHIGMIPILNYNIPLYLTKETLMVLEFFDETGELNLELKRRPVTIIEDKKPFFIKDIEVIPHFIDHDLKGACGFFIRCGNKTVIYTGDFRLHGRNPEVTEEFFKSVKNEKGAILLTEGTRLGWGAVSNPTEEDIKKELIYTFSNSSGLFLANHYFMDLERVKTFYEVSKSIKRTLVFPLKSYHFLNKFRSIDKEIDKILKDNKVMPYIRRKGEGNYKDSDYDEWEKSYLLDGIKAKEILENEENFLILLDFVDFTELVELNPKPPSIFIHSGGEPLGIYDNNHTVLQKWLKYFKVSYFRIATPGHASEIDIKRMIKIADPEILIPIHTKSPESLLGTVENIKIVSKGVEYSF